MKHPAVELHPEAIAEATEAREWYFERSAAAADALMAELDEAIEQIGNAPHRWGQYLLGTRHVVLRRFPFAVVYQYDGEIAYVVAVAHAKRKPGYWAERLRSQ